MSEENVETIRAFYEVYNRRDFDHLPKPLHPDIEVVPSGDQAPIKGAARVRAWMEPDAFESQVIEPLDLRPVGDKVLVRGHSKNPRGGQRHRGWVPLLGRLDLRRGWAHHPGRSSSTTRKPRRSMPPGCGSRGSTSRVLIARPEKEE